MLSPGLQDPRKMILLDKIIVYRGAAGAAEKNKFFWYPKHWHLLAIRCFPEIPVQEEKTIPIGWNTSQGFLFLMFVVGDQVQETISKIYSNGSKKNQDFPGFSQILLQFFLMSVLGFYMSTSRKSWILAPVFSYVRSCGQLGGMLRKQ